MSVDRKIPAFFEKLNDFDIKSDDSRFLHVKIWLMHLGENLNGSYFSKEVVESAIPTLANTPINVYLEENSDDELDFSDHRQILVVKNGSYDIKYIGQAIGTIPESNNAQFEDRLCDDGVTRTFLTVEGVIWTKWDDPIDIFNRDKFKAQSMELHSDYEGNFNEEDGLFHFTKFKFYGACGLGKEVLPAMQNSTIEVNFNLDALHKEIQEKMEQFKLALNNRSQKGGKKMDELQQLLDKYSLTLEDLSSKEIKHEELSLEELESKIKEVFEANKFTLTSEQLEDELKRELAEIETITEEYWGEIYSYPRFSFVDYMPEQSVVVAYDGKENILIGFNYSMVNENVEVDSKSAMRFKVEYVPMNLAGDTDPDELDNFSRHFTSLSKVDQKLKIKEGELNKKFSEEKLELQNNIEKLNGDFSKLKDDFSALEEKANELEQFKLSSAQKEREDAEEALFSSFELTEDEMAPIKEIKSQLSLEDIEEKLFALVGRKNAKLVTKNQNEPPIRFSLPVDDKPTSDKEYADLIEKHRNK